MKKLNTGFDEPSDTMESQLQPQGQLNNIIREVNQHYEYTSPGRNNIRSPESQHNIYDDLAKN